MNVLIVEDESHTSKLLKEIIEQDEDFLVTEIIESISEAVLYLSKHQQKLDLLFLDIQLADGYSFEIFRHVDVMIPVVFCTAYDEFSLQAIKNNGIDYILKPFKEVAIFEALSKYKRFSQTFREKATAVKFQTQQQFQQSFLTQYRNKILVKNVKDIALFQIETETVYMFTFSGEKYPLFKNLEYLESVCNPNCFFRISRQALVNRDAIVSMENYFNRKLILELNFALENKPVVSRKKVTELKKWLDS